MNPAVAREIARVRLAGLSTRFGEPFIEHVDRVASAVPADARTAAYLHDVLEHTTTSVSELRDEGLDAMELETLMLLTRQPGETFEAHTLRVAYAHGRAGVLARTVRHADLDDHLAHRPMPSAVPPYGWARRHIVSAEGRAA